VEPPGGILPLTEIEHRPAHEPVAGWRYWLLQPSTGRLGSVSHRRIEWHPGRPLQALCLTGGHAAPSPGCACGIHASPDREHLLAEGLCLAPRLPLVLGRVGLWGAVVADGHGWRGQYAYPVELFLVADTATGSGGAAAGAQLAAYGVPTATVALAEAVGEVSAAILTFQAMSSPPVS